MHRGRRIVVKFAATKLLANVTSALAPCAETNRALSTWQTLGASSKHVMSAPPTSLHSQSTSVEVGPAALSPAS